MQRIPHRLAGGGPLALLVLAALAVAAVVATGEVPTGRPTGDVLQRELGGNSEARWSLALDGAPLRPPALPVGARRLEAAPGE